MRQTLHAKLMLHAALIAFSFNPTTASAEVQGEENALKSLPNKTFNSLIGRKFDAQPIDPRLGNMSPVFPKIESLHLYNNIWGVPNRIRAHPNDHTFTHEQYQRSIQSLSERATHEYHSPDGSLCNHGIYGAFSKQSNVLLVIRACNDNTFEITDVLRLKEGVGLVGAENPNPTKRRNSTYHALLPTRFFSKQYCPNYGKYFIDVKSNGGRAYELSEEGKLHPTSDPEIKAQNPNQYCGEQP